MIRRGMPILLVLAVACGESGSGAPIPPVEEVLEQTRSAMAAVDTADFEMAVSGAPVEITGLEFLKATGSYAAPDRAQAILSMIVGNITIAVATISVGARTWVTDPLTTEWTELAPGVGFNPAVLFGDEGWTALFSGALVEPQIQGTARGRYVLTAIAPADRVERLTAGVVSGQAVEIEFLIDRASGRVVGADFTTTAPAGETRWRIRLGPFDEPVEIEAPIPG
jgi:hypothetical protein